MILNNLIKFINDEYYNVINENDYRGFHKAPSPDSEDAPMYNLTNIYPDNIYSDKAVKLYGVYRDYRDVQAINVIQSAKDNPNKKIKIYRAVPLNKNITEINNGDWVTTVKDYAKEHGRSRLHNKYKILTKTVFAKNLYNEGNSIFEWGYYI